VTLSRAERRRLICFCSWGGRCGRERPAEVGAGGRQSRPQRGGDVLPLVAHLKSLNRPYAA